MKKETARVDSELEKEVEDLTFWLRLKVASKSWFYVFALLLNVHVYDHKLIDLTQFQRRQEFQNWPC